MDKCTDSTSDSSDEEPLSKFIQKLTDDLANKTQPDSGKASEDCTGDSADDKPLYKKSQANNLSNTTQSELNSESTGKKDDDLPLKKTLRISLPVKMPGESKGNKRGNKKTETPAVESSDDEPLSRHTKKTSAAAEGTAPLPLKKRPVNRARKNSNANKSRNIHTDSPSDSSDDFKPLSKMAKKTRPQRKTKTPPSAARKSPRKASSKLQMSEGSGDSSDDEPQGKTKTPPRSARKSPRKAPRKLQMSEGSGDSSDDEPQRKTKTPPSSARKSPRKAPRKLQRSEGSGDGSDDEPLIRRTRKSPGRRGNPVSKRGQRANGHKEEEEEMEEEEKEDSEEEKAEEEKEDSEEEKEEEEKEDSEEENEEEEKEDSDEEPLIKLVKKPKSPIKKTRTPVKKTAKTMASRKRSVRAVGRKKTKAAQITRTSDESSDDEPLIKLVKKPSKVVKKPSKVVKKPSKPDKKPSKRGKKTTKPTHKRGRTAASKKRVDSDDEPLRKRPALAINERTKRNLKPVRYTSKGSSNDDSYVESSDDEPLRKKSALAIKQRSRRNIRPVQYTNKGSSNDGSDDEPLIKMVKNDGQKPVITKTAMLELERVEDAFENFNRGSTSKICGGEEETPADELVKMTTSPPEPLGEIVAEEMGKGELNCDKEP